MTPGYGFGYGFGLRTPQQLVSGWTPSDLPDKIAWWRSDLGVFTDPDGIWKWEDQSGNGYNLLQSTGSLKPDLLTDEMDGHDAVQCDGLDDQLVAAMSHATSPHYVYIVMKDTHSNNNERFMLCDGTTGNFILSRRIQKYYSLYDGVEWETRGVRGISPSDTPTIVEWQQNAASAFKVYVDNVEYALNGAGDGTVIDSSLDNDFQFPGGGGLQLVSKVFEILLTSSMSAENRTLLYSYADGRYPTIGL